MARERGAVSFARWAIDQFGNVVNDQATVRVSQAELARCYRVSASTVGWYISELGDAVVCRRPLVLNLALLVSPAEPRNSAAEFAGLSQGFRKLAAEIARLAADCTGPAADSASFLEREVAEDLLFSPRDPNGQPAGSCDRLDNLLAPLVDVAARRGLAGMVHPDGVRAALANFSSEQIAGAVARVIGDIETGAAIRRPFGVLVARATEGDTSLFRALEEPSTAAVVPLVPRFSPQPADLPTAERGDFSVDVPVDVPAVPGELAAELDREAARQVAERFPAMADRMLANAPLRRALVASLWKERWLRQSGTSPDGHSRVS